MAYVNISLINDDEVTVQNHPADPNSVVIRFGWPTYVSLTRDDALKLVANLTALLNPVEAVAEEVAA
jgi:hypothetical protein